MDPAFLQALGVSLKLAFWVCLFLLLLGVPLAWSLAFRNFPGKTLLEALFLLPSVLPPSVLGFYLLLFLGPEGPWRKALGLDWAFSFPGLVLAGVVFSLPYTLTAYREAFLGLDRSLLETARTLGAGPLKLWGRVVLPLAWPSLLSGTLLAFAHALGEFGVVLMVGGGIPGRTETVSIYIYNLVQALALEEALRASLFILALSLLLAYLARILERRWRGWRSGTA